GCCYGQVASISCCADFGRLCLLRGRSWGWRFALHRTGAHFSNVVQRGMIIERNDWCAPLRVMPLLVVV
ncbi:MAG: hypothetical protein RLN85_05405, partial [Pseudomonadales bacterium]